MVDLKHLGLRLALAKAKNNWTLLWMAKEFGVSRETIRNVVNSEVTSMTLAKYDALDKGLRKHGF